MAQKYLSIEEAAEFLGMPQDELTRIRESGELRGFADRGTWKFQTEAVEEYHRSRQADSSVEGGLVDELLPVSDDGFASPDAPSILDDDDDVAADGPTLIRQSVEDDEPLLRRLGKDLHGKATIQEIRDKLSHLVHEAKRQLLHEQKKD